jgi:transposase
VRSVAGSSSGNGDDAVEIRREEPVVVPVEVETEIKRLFFAEHWPVGTVARQLDVHEDVVRRVVGLTGRRRPSKPRAKLVDAYEGFIGFIDEVLRQYPTLRATRLHEMVKARGFEGSVRTLRDYVADVRPRPKHEAYLRTEPLVGEQAQVDWAHVGEIDVDGGRRVVWLFVIVLSWSRATWGELVMDTTAPSLARSLCRAAAHFGGVTRQWLFDNAKSVVVERSGDAARFHPLLVELSGHYRVQLRLCTPRKANQKGRVERAIRYLREAFLAGRTIFSVEQGNRELWRFLDEVAARRRHPTQAEHTVSECFATERPRLLPLPETPFATDVVVPVAVDKTAFIRFETNAYSVPSEHARKTLTLVADDAIVRVVDGKTEVARHARSYGRRRTIEDPAHRQALIDEKRAASEAKGRDRLRALVPNIDALYERWVHAGRNVGNMTGQVIRLLDLYGDDLFAAAVAEVIARGTHDPGAIAVLCEHKRRLRQRPVPMDFELGSHVPDKDVVHHDLETYDGKRRRD